MRFPGNQRPGAPFAPQSALKGHHNLFPEQTMSVFKGRLRPFVLVLAALAGLAFTAGRTPAASTFDGEWSVVIITEAGTCDRAYRYPVRVTNGQVAYHGEANVTLTGHVDPNGKLNATVRRGDQSASGSGRLSSSTGAGTWTGKSSTSNCAGRWEAEKRAG
jgi:hypothetical protein